MIASMLLLYIQSPPFFLLSVRPRVASSFADHILLHKLALLRPAAAAPVVGTSAPVVGTLRDSSALFTARGHLCVSEWRRHCKLSGNSLTAYLHS